jgi:hypothetical protein
MKKISILLFILMTNLLAFCQKDELAQKIKEDYAWMQGVAFENMVTLNLSESMWVNVMDENKNPQGKKHFASLGTALIECHDFLFDTKIIGKCDGGSHPSASTKTDCEKEIIADKNKITVTVNGATVKYTDMSYRLMFGYITCIDNFVGNSSWYYGFNRYWRPKNLELHIVLELSEVAKEIAVKWSTDGKTATIVGPVGREVDEWDAKIGKGLENNFILFINTSFYPL